MAIYYQLHVTSYKNATKALIMNYRTGLYREEAKYGETNSNTIKNKSDIREL